MKVLLQIRPWLGSYAAASRRLLIVDSMDVDFRVRILNIGKGDVLMEDCQLRFVLVSTWVDRKGVGPARMDGPIVWRIPGTYVRTCSGACHLEGECDQRR